MGVVASVQRQKAFLRDGVWRCAHSGIEDRLNDLTDRWIAETGGPPLDSVDPELETAREILRRAGGRLLLQVPADARASAKTYFEKRQYKLAF